MNPEHPVVLSMLIVKLAAQACESCCQRPVDYIVYDSFVCQSCAAAS